MLTFFSDVKWKDVAVTIVIVFVLLFILGRR